MRPNLERDDPRDYFQGVLFALKLVFVVASILGGLKEEKTVSHA